MMDDNIGITMLGTTGSGKTCYMLGMYAVMREGVEGFTFTTRDEDPDLDMDLELSERWERLVYGTGPERWPEANSVGTKSYAFDFTYGLSRMIGFDWIDYRGGALRDTPSEADVRELKQHLSRSSAVLLCVSGENFVPGRPRPVSAGAETPRMIKFLIESLQSRRERPAVGIVITKFDLCRHLEEEVLLERVRSLFSPVFVPDEGWLVMVCPVSLGNALAADPGSGAVEPINVHLPVSFAVYSAFRRGQSEVERRISSKQDEIDGLRGGRFRTWWNSGRIDSGNREKERLLKQKETIEKKLRLLTDDLVRGARFYYDGERMELDG